MNLSLVLCAVLLALLAIVPSATAQAAAQSSSAGGNFFPELALTEFGMRLWRLNSYAEMYTGYSDVSVPFGNVPLWKPNFPKAKMLEAIDHYFNGAALAVPGDLSSWFIKFFPGFEPTTASYIQNSGLALNFEPYFPGNYLPIAVGIPNISALQLFWIELSNSVVPAFNPYPYGEFFINGNVACFKAWNTFSFAGQVWDYTTKVMIVVELNATGYPLVRSEFDTYTSDAGGAVLNDFFGYLAGAPSVYARADGVIPAPVLDMSKPLPYLSAVEKFLREVRTVGGAVRQRAKSLVSTISGVAVPGQTRKTFVPLSETELKRGANKLISFMKWKGRGIVRANDILSSTLVAVPSDLVVTVGRDEFLNYFKSLHGNVTFWASNRVQYVTYNDNAVHFEAWFDLFDCHGNLFTTPLQWSAYFGADGKAFYIEGFGELKTLAAQRQRASLP